jgi:thiamine kinase-like enzyme
MEQIKIIREQFGIPNADWKFERASQGLINDTFFVKLAGERKYVLQRINEDVFPNSSALIENLELTLPFLSATDYVFVKYFRTSEGESFYRDISGQLWRLMSYIPSSTSFHTSSEPKIAFEAGRIIGVFHRQVAQIDPSNLQITLDRFHDLEWRLEQYREALKRANKKDIQRTAELQGQIIELSKDLRDVDSSHLPIRVCHNDTKLNNILFSQDKKALCLIDLDTLMPGLSLYDIGDAVRTIANPAAEEEKDLRKIDFCMEMFSAFIEGLALSKDVFTQKEITSFTLSGIYMPLLHGIRAYTDFLLGNVYYKVDYPDQNLDRARSLMHFAYLAHERRADMHEIICKKML